MTLLAKPQEIHLGVMVFTLVANPILIILTIVTLGVAVGLQNTEPGRITVVGNSTELGSVTARNVTLTIGAHSVVHGIPTVLTLVRSDLVMTSQRKTNVNLYNSVYI